MLQVAVQNIKGDVNPSMPYVSPATQKHINATLLGVSQTPKDAHSECILHMKVNGI